MMRKETHQFIEDFDKHLISPWNAGQQIDPSAWKHYISALPYIYNKDIAFRLLFDWHFDRSNHVGNSSILVEGVDMEDSFFLALVELINGIGKNIYRSDYQFRELMLCHARVNLRGKRILEVGGIMSNEILFDLFGISEYINIESPDYIHLKENGVPISDGFQAHENKRTILCNAEEICMHLDPNSLDLVFSVACFEHIHDLKKALRSMHSCLTKGGALYSYFAPIYSELREGDHGVIPKHNLLPEKPVGFHLLSQNDQYRKLIELGINDPNEIQDFLERLNLNRTPNRFLYEDYERILTESPFWVLELHRLDSFNISKDFPDIVSNIRESNPSIGNLMTIGFRTLLLKN